MKPKRFYLENANQMWGGSGSSHLYTFLNPRKRRSEAGPIQFLGDGYQRAPRRLFLGNGKPWEKKTQFWKGCGHEGIMQSRISEYLSWTMLQLKLIRKKMSLNPILKVAVWHRRVQTPTWRIVISNGRRLGHPTWQTMTDLHSKICVVALAHVWLKVHQAWSRWKADAKKNEQQKPCLVSKCGFRSSGESAMIWDWIKVTSR